MRSVSAVWSGTEVGQMCFKNSTRTDGTVYDHVCWETRAGASNSVILPRKPQGTQCSHLPQKQPLGQTTGHFLTRSHCQILLSLPLFVPIITTFQLCYSPRYSTLPIIDNLAPALHSTLRLCVSNTCEVPACIALMTLAKFKTAWFLELLAQTTCLF